MQPKPKPRYRVTRNERWADSVKIMLVSVVFDAPSSALRSLVVPIVAFFWGSGMLVTAIGAWVLSRLFLIIAGAAGFLSPNDKEKS